MRAVLFERCRCLVGRRVEQSCEQLLARVLERSQDRNRGGARRRETREVREAAASRRRIAGSIVASYSRPMKSCVWRSASAHSSRQGAQTIVMGGSGSLERVAASEQAARARADALQLAIAGRR